MSQVYVALSSDDPIMVAWDKYKLSEDYANSLKWAAYEEHRPGSLWGAFLAGYKSERHSDPPPRRLFTLPKFAERHWSFLTLPALTNQVFKARSRESSKGVIPGNGMLDYGAIVRINARVLIDEDRYFRWLDSKQSINSSEDRAPREPPRLPGAKPAHRRASR